MLYKEIIAVCSTNRMEHINTRCGQNPGIREVRAYAFLGVKLSLVRNVTSRIGHVIAQVATGWLVTADDWFHSQFSLCGIDGLSGTEKGFSVHAPVVHPSSSVNQCPKLIHTSVTDPAQSEQLTPSLNNAHKETWQVVSM